MNGLVKKVITAVAIKEGIEKIQEMRQPKRSFLSRMFRPIVFLSLAGGVAYLQQTGKLGPLLQKAKGLSGGSSGTSFGGASTTSNGSGAPLASSSTGNI
jgi:uncharacterized protein GlcG (DUF336 family)